MFMMRRQIEYELLIRDINNNFYNRDMRGIIILYMQYNR
jgi:hypothetical protein